MAKPHRAHPEPGASKKKRTPKQVALRILLGLVIAGVALVLVGAAAFAWVYSQATIPNLREDFQTNTSTVLFRDGERPISTFAIQNRESISIDEMPANAKEAIVAGENENFWTDPGISVAGLTRAVISALGPGQTVGGSTITQQYVKVAYLNQEKTLTRKLNEIIIALKVSKDLSKEQILEGYLNTVYFGRGAYGLQAASRAFFDVDAKDLTYPQAIALTAMINDPGRLDPLQGDKQRSDLLERYQYTINQLVKTGKITEAQKAEWYTTLPEFPALKRDNRFAGPNGYLMKMVEKELKGAGFDAAQVEGGGLRIITTIDAKMQDAAATTAQQYTARAAAEKKRDPAKLHAAIASVDTASGAILASYGGPDYVSAPGQNWAMTPRPTGSTFKTWAVVAALRDGITLNDTFNGRTLLSATTHSNNGAFLDLTKSMKGGPEKVAKAALDAGQPDVNFTRADTIALGFAEVSPVNAAAGYATLANEGRQVKPFIVAEVHDAKGQVLYKAAPEHPQSIEPDIARDTTYALTHVTREGTGRVVSGLGYPVAGKTGTRYVKGEGTKASWFVGYTKQISTAVMYVAGDQGSDDLDYYSRGFYGMGYPANTWLAYMKVAMQGLPKENFPPPTKRTSTRAPIPPSAASTQTPAEPDPSEEPLPDPSAEPAPEPEPEPAPEPDPTTQPSAPPSAPPTTEAPQPTQSAPVPPGQGGQPPGQRPKQPSPTPTG